MTHRLLTILTSLCLAALTFVAPTAEGKEQDRFGFKKISEGEHNGVCPDRWTCIIGGADNAMTSVKLSAITSVSKQTYMLEGAQKVVEVTIDTLGNNSIRFYSLSSERVNRVTDRLSNAKALLDKHTENASRYPAKKYPEATHSHNIEYQLSTTEQVHRIYESVMHAWVKGVAISLSLNG